MQVVLEYRCSPEDLRRMSMQQKFQMAAVVKQLKDNLALLDFSVSTFREEGMGDDLVVRGVREMDVDSALKKMVIQ